eukprot:1161401-Pelagomonas_calceolata.AAC.21
MAEAPSFRAHISQNGCKAAPTLFCCLPAAPLPNLCTSACPSTSSGGFNEWTDHMHTQKMLTRLEDTPCLLDDIKGFSRTTEAAYIMCPA